MLTPTIKTYADLRLNDEFDCFHDDRWKRVRVASIPRIEGGCVEFTICPVTKRGALAPERRQFAIGFTVEVYGDRSDCPIDTNREYENLILRLLKPGMSALSARDICDLATRKERVKLFQERVADVCATLARTGALIRRNNRYRRPIRNQVGLFVVEHLNTRSERYGWISARKYHKQTKQLEAVIRWVDGSESFSNEVFLDPLETAWKRQWLMIAQRIQQGDRPADLNLSLPLIHGLLRFEQSALQEIANLAGFNTKIRGMELRNQLVEWLGDYRPAWKEQQQ
jgi:hypothetical protein